MKGRIPTDAEKKVFGADVEFDTKGHVIEKGVGSAYAVKKSQMADADRLYREEAAHLGLLEDDPNETD